MWWGTSGGLERYYGRKSRTYIPPLGCYFKVSGEEGISGVILAGPFESPLAGLLAILPQMRGL